jgi:hypothetical protein
MRRSSGDCGEILEGKTESAAILLAALFAVTAYFCTGHRDFDFAVLLDLLF